MVKKFHNPPGQPDKLTPERAAAIIESISHCIPYEIAAEANGICEDTLYEWLLRGRNDLKKGVDSKYAQFSESIKRTEMAKIKENLDTIKDSPERWQARAWILERRWWKHFSPSAAVVDFNKRLEKMESEGVTQGESLNEQIKDQDKE